MAFENAKRAWFARLSGRRDRYRRVFQTPEGEAVLADLAKLNFCLPGDSPAVVGNRDATQFQCGQQFAIGRILKLLNVDSGHLQTMAENLAKQEAPNETD